MNNPTVRDMLANFENWSQDQSGIPVADTGWFNAAVYEAFLLARASLYESEHKKDITSSNKFVIQNLGCLALEEVRVEDCPCAPPSGCTWFKTKDPLPLPIGVLHSVTSIGGNLQQLKHFTYKDWHTIKYTLSARNPAERTRGYYTIKNGHLYLAAERLKAIAISGVFFDPAETQRHPQCEPFSDCKPFLDYELYIDPAHYQTLIGQTFQLIGGLKNQAPLDTSSNAQVASTVEPVK